MSQELTVRS